MPTYFFHLHERGTVIADEEGTELADDKAAFNSALRAARDVLAGAVAKGCLPLSDIVVVTDRAGRTLFSLTLGAAVGEPPA